jgi:NAD(P)-dependent dehydrogenase (short-subunit alcohol dehydrogenase family)
MTTETGVAATQREPELAGQTVVVIGGSAGIGLETARRARAEGADVILTGRYPERLQRAATRRAARPDGQPRARVRADPSQPHCARLRRHAVVRVAARR